MSICVTAAAWELAFKEKPECMRCHDEHRSRMYYIIEKGQDAKMDEWYMIAHPQWELVGRECL